MGVKAFQYFPQVAAVAHPAAAAGPPFAVDKQCGDIDRDFVTVGGYCLGDPFGVFQGGGANVDPPGAGGEGALQGGVVADSAGEFHMNVELGDDVRHEFVVGSAAEGGIKVDEMKPGRASILPGFCGVEGGTVGLFGTRRSLVESHRLTVNYINSGEESKSHSFKV